LRSIAGDFNRRGVAAAGGGEWSPQSLRRMLASARIAGLRKHHGEVVAEAEWARDHHSRTASADPRVAR